MSHKINASIHEGTLFICFGARELSAGNEGNVGSFDAGDRAKKIPPADLIALLAESLNFVGYSGESKIERAFREAFDDAVTTWHVNEDFRQREAERNQQAAQELEAARLRETPQDE